jgi:hypothetical protein
MSQPNQGMYQQQQQPQMSGQQQQRFPSQWSQVPPQVQGMHQQSMQPQQQQQRMNSPRYSAMTPQMTMNQGITQTTSNQLPSYDIMTFMSDGLAILHQAEGQQNPRNLNPSDQLSYFVENL